MATKFSLQGVTVLLVMASSLFAVSVANKDWYFGFNYTDWWSRFGSHPKNPPQQQSKIINVGDSQNWRFGFNYTDWALKTGPFYLNDTLVFKYDPPSNGTFPHSVYMFSNYWSFLNCDLKRAKRVANWTQGAGEGFQFVLKRWQPHYFACGERNGIHCRDGLMKFAVLPAIRPYWPLP